MLLTTGQRATSVNKRSINGQATISTEPVTEICPHVAAHARIKTLCCLVMLDTYLVWQLTTTWSAKESQSRQEKFSIRQLSMLLKMACLQLVLINRIFQSSIIPWRLQAEGSDAELSKKHLQTWNRSITQRLLSDSATCIPRSTICQTSVPETPHVLTQVQNSTSKSILTTCSQVTKVTDNCGMVPPGELRRTSTPIKSELPTGTSSTSQSLSTWTSWRTRQAVWRRDLRSTIPMTTQPLLHSETSPELEKWRNEVWERLRWIINFKQSN